MKGIVFTELVEMAEDRFGPEVVDQMIESSELENGGAYSAVGTYDHREILRMVGQLSSLTNVDGGTLVRAFGEHMFSRFSTLYPQFFTGIGSTFEFLPRIESYIHVEVRKLYPDAELPSFECRQPSAQTLELDYRSQRPFADLAEGLVAGCVRHFEENISISREDFTPASGFAARFTLTRAN